MRVTENSRVCIRVAWTEIAAAVFAACTGLAALPAGAAQIELHDATITERSQILSNAEGYYVKNGSQATITYTSGGSAPELFYKTSVDLNNSGRLKIKETLNYSLYSPIWATYFHGGSDSVLDIEASTTQSDSSILGTFDFDTHERIAADGKHNVLIDVGTASLVNNMEPYHYAIYTSSYSGNGQPGSWVEVKAKKITLKAGEAVFAQSGNRVTLSGFDSLDITSGTKSAIRTLSDSTIEVLGNSGSTATISNDGSRYAAVQSGQAGASTVLKAGSLIMNSANNSAVDAEVGSVTIQADQIQAETGVTGTQSVNTSSNGGGNGNVFMVKSGGEVTFKNFNGSSDPSSFKATGNIYVEDGGKAVFPFAGSSSSLTGGALVEGGSAALQFKNGASWNMTMDSSVSNLEVESAAINVGYNAPEGTYRKLTIGTLTGSDGTFSLRADVNADKADQIIITDKASGSHKLLVAGSGSEPLPEAMSAFLVQETASAVSAGSDATFALANQGGYVNVIDQGNYVYTLADRTADTDSGQAREWYLKRVERPVEPVTPDEPVTPVEPANPDKPVVPTVPILSPSAATVLAMGSSSSMTSNFITGLDDLRKRLGDARHQDGTGLWASAGGSYSRLTGYQGKVLRKSAFRVNVGADRKAGDWILGGYFHFTTSDDKARNDWNTSRGDSNSQSFSLYATRLFAGGSYLDIVAGADLYHQEMRGTMLDGRGFKGNYTTHGFGVSVEGGHQFCFGEKGAWFVEPSLQASWYRAEGADYRLTNGMKVDEDSMTSVTGRAGVLAGRRFFGADGNFTGDLYVRGGVLYEFDGDQTVHVNGEKYDVDGLGARGYAGIGGEKYLNKSVKLYGYLETQHGHRYATELEGRLGLKVSF